jgi:putative NIF3 family GTP cyclohydrolase 1 type 2
MRCVSVTKYIGGPEYDSTKQEITNWCNTRRIKTKVTPNNVYIKLGRVGVTVIALSVLLNRAMTSCSAKYEVAMMSGESFDKVSYCSGDGYMVTEEYSFEDYSGLFVSSDFKELVNFVMFVKRQVALKSIEHDITL